MNTIVLQIVEMVSSILNLTFSIIIKKEYERQPSHIATPDQVNLREMLHQESEIVQSKHQLVVIGIGLFITSLIRTARAGVGFYLGKL